MSCYSIWFVLLANNDLFFPENNGVSVALGYFLWHNGIQKVYILYNSYDDNVNANNN